MCIRDRVLALVPASAHATLEYLIVTTAFSSLWSPARLSQRPGIPECTAGQDPRLLVGRVVDRGQSHRRKPKRKVNHENQNQNRGQSPQATLRVPPGDKATNGKETRLGHKNSYMQIDNNTCRIPTGGRGAVRGQIYNTCMFSRDRRMLNNPCSNNPMH